MQDFVGRIEHHLRRVQSIEASEVIEADRPPDLPHHDEVAVDLIDRLAKQSSHAATRLDYGHSLWETAAVAHFVDEVHWELLASFGAHLSHGERRDAIDLALEAAITRDLSSLEMPPVRGLHGRRLQKLGETVRAEVQSWSEGRYPWQVVSRYCEHVGLVRARPNAPGLKLAGHTWLSLRGLDRLRWLFALESVRGTGRDEWCIGPRGVEIIKYAGSRFFPEDDDLPPAELPWSNVERWSALGALSVWAREDDDAFGYDLTDIGEKLFGDADTEALAVFTTLAEAQAEDDRQEALRFGRHREQVSEAAPSVLRQARLVAHEVRNALLPIRHAIDKVWAAVERVGVAESLLEPRARIEEGISRLYRFVDASIRTSSGVAEAPAAFALLEVVDEARRALAADFTGSVRIETLPGTANPKLHGHRERAVLAMTNILRNAVQSGGSGVHISISIDARDPDLTRMTVEDNGPGVPEAIRERVFDHGVSGRPEGSGHGLALVREVVEHDLGGRVTCEQPVAGGARFHIELPTEKQ